MSADLVIKGGTLVDGTGDVPRRGEVAITDGRITAIGPDSKSPWDAEVLEHEKTARGRGRIKTASYAQVAQPIYSQSAGRWTNYRKHLEPVLPVLEPWIAKFGYTV